MNKRCAPVNQLSFKKADKEVLASLYDAPTNNIVSGYEEGMDTSSGLQTYRLTGGESISFD